MTVSFAGLDDADKALREAVVRVSRAGHGRFFPLDFLAWAGANRSLALIRGFRELMVTRNYLTAASLVRLQIDTALRFKAAWHVDDPHALAEHVLSGERLDRYLDSEGKRLTDRRLVSLASAEAPWLEQTYRETSGFVHLSDKHIFGAIADLSEDRAFQMRASSEDPEHLPDRIRQECIDGFTAAVRLQIRYLEGWAATKAAAAEGGET